MAPNHETDKAGEEDHPPYDCGVHLVYLHFGCVLETALILKEVNENQGICNNNEGPDWFPIYGSEKLE